MYLYQVRIDFSLFVFYCKILISSIQHSKCSQFSLKAIKYSDYKYSCNLPKYKILIAFYLKSAISPQETFENVGFLKLKKNFVIIYIKAEAFSLIEYKRSKTAKVYLYGLNKCVVKSIVKQDYEHYIIVISIYNLSLIK